MVVVSRMLQWYSCMLCGNFKDATVVVISRMLQWYSCMFFKGFPSMPKGEIVGMFLDRGKVCVFVIDGDVIDGKDQHDQ